MQFKRHDVVEYCNENNNDRWGIIIIGEVLGDNLYEIVAWRAHRDFAGHDGWNVGYEDGENSENAWEPGRAGQLVRLHPDPEAAWTAFTAWRLLNG